jgi:OFA family oxalate/formate antiporter-like MFS transporter
MIASDQAVESNPATVFNRWKIAVAGMVMQLALGAIYAWSLFVGPLSKAHPTWTRTDITLTFSIALVALGFGAILGGTLLEKRGPRWVGTLSGVLYGAGFIGAGLLPSLWGLYFTYGLTSGLGMGLGYIVPLATLIKWFPDKRGLITGLAVAGFGGGAVLTTLVAPSLIKALGLYPTFILFGAVYLFLVVGAAQQYQAAPVGFAPAGWKPNAMQAKQRAAYDYSLPEALRTWQWPLLWAILFLNVTAGVMLISQAAPMAQEITGVSKELATSIVIFISVANGVGRLFWAWLSDLITRRYVFIIMFGLQAALFFVMPGVRSFSLLATLMISVALCYGGGFGTMPAFAADYFGPRYAGKVYGLMLSAWSAGGVLGPVLIAQVKDRTNTYRIALTVIAAMMLASILLPVIARPPQRAPAPSD